MSCFGSGKRYESGMESLILARISQTRRTGSNLAHRGGAVHTLVICSSLLLLGICQKQHFLSVTPRCDVVRKVRNLAFALRKGLTWLATCYVYVPQIRARSRDYHESLNRSCSVALSSGTQRCCRSDLTNLCSQSSLALKSSCRSRLGSRNPHSNHVRQ